MVNPHIVAKIVNFFRAGYPERVPPRDYFPALALLKRRLTDQEVVAVATELTSLGIMPIQGTDIRAAIIKITKDMPSQSDTDRVKERLQASGWEISDLVEPRDT
jgi:hypothetical protein